MQPRATEVSAAAIEPWRARYRAEMDCLICQDGAHSREGWVRPYLLHLGDAVAGYGAILLPNPWRDRPTLFEFYLDPAHRSRQAECFAAVLAASAATGIRAQTNDPLLAPLLAAHGREIVTEKIVFRDERTTALPAGAAVFRPLAEDERAGVFEHQREPVGDWALEVAGAVVATGGLSGRVNPPYGEIFMEVAGPFRRRGLGSYLVQELKRVCRGEGRIPGARCDPGNLPSRRTLQQAGFIPCAELRSGIVAAPPA
jgi:GNAT superfamily N-acetyltransferase